jgi:branched-subunit amino acid permease
LAALGLLIRKKNWKRFKLIHSLNIIAFIWISLHGIIKDAVPALGVNYPQLILLSLMNLVIISVLITGAKVKKKR